MSAMIRTFRAPDAREALEAIKLALGPDAVILGTREVKGGLFRKNEVEVTAALPHAAEVTGKAAAAAARYAAPAKATAQETEAAEAAERREEFHAALREELRKDFVAPPRAETRAEPPGLQPSASVRDELAKLRAELQTMKSAPALPSAAEALLKHLLNRGMEEELARDAITQAVERAEQQTAPQLMAALREVLAERVLAGRAPWLADRRRIIGLIGPTGVGKTTTLAKLAAHAVKDGQKVALITVDTFRVGASEQLGHYGSIMQVPSFVARNRNELEQIVSQCSRVDLILIDTAGSPDPKAVQKQAELVRSISGAQLHLVVSVAAGPRDLAAVVEKYRHLAPERLILTKLDEAACPAAFLSASFRLSRPIVAVTDGQRVPEDIRSPSTPELVELLIGAQPVTRNP
ncbi:MAG: flagellar biosynthesis protein FlhF [Archangiaceae bacterium]|nr:flagellar biosynthesis protein FlhF [Archangiaceae bacterium]